MSKRSAEEELGSLKSGERPTTAAGAQNGLDAEQFEDDYEDEFESEDEIMEAGVDGRPDEEREAEEEEDKMDVDNKTFIPGRHKLDPGQTLAPDLSTYEMLHTLETDWPCLSFDILQDQLGSGKARKKYPATAYAVAGTQAAQGRDKENEILVMKMSKLSKMDRPEEDSSEEEDDDDDENTDPILETKRIRTGTCTNRIRAYQAPQSDPSQPSTTLTAAMTESGSVLLHNITPHLTMFDTPGSVITPQQNKPMHTITSHGKSEGYAIDWSPASITASAPKLLTGDTSGRVFLHTISANGSVTSSSKPYTGHISSVEELQWSRQEPTVFASGSADGTVKIWDTRSKSQKPQLSVQTSKTDINVLSWSHLSHNLLATGADDGVWAIWDLRNWQSGNTSAPPAASFDFHKEQVTSVEWHPTDDSVVCVAAGDNTVTLWDLAVEHDDEESKYTADAKEVPPQLLFVHYMEQVKEAHWHPQAPGQVMATGGSGFGIFKTISV